MLHFLYLRLRLHEPTIYCVLNAGAPVLLSSEVE